jgi:hypothetical protein
MLFYCIALATHDLIGFSHPKARYFLLLRQKQVSKEKATRLPLASCALPFLLGVAKGTSLSLWQRAASLLRSFGLFPIKMPVLGAAYGKLTLPA